MGETTKIAWTDSTINLWWGCSKVAQGCKNCYAENLARRWGYDVWGAGVTYREILSAFSTLAKMQRKARKSGRKKMVFIGSMMDIFDENVPISDTWKTDHKTTTTRRAALMYRVGSGNFYPDLVFQFLTKRPYNIENCLPPSWYEGAYPKNVWIGASAATHEEARLNVASLIENSPDDANLFMSLEPMIGPIHLGDIGNIQRIQWVIAGGESGKTSVAREFSPSWLDDVISQCRSNDIGLFVKQMGTHWAVQNNTYYMNKKGGDIDLWSKEYRIRESMPVVGGLDKEEFDRGEIPF